MSEIKFPCCVDCTSLSMEQRLDLQEAFEKLGACVWDYAGDYGTLSYYGVDSHIYTQWYDYISSFSATGEEYKVSVYTYEEVMAMVSSEEPREETTQQLTPAYEVGDIVEIIDSLYGHGFETGQHIRLCSRHSDGGWGASDLEDTVFRYVGEDEFKPVSSVSDIPETSCSDDTAISEENEYSDSSKGETGCNQSVGASVKFSVQKEYKIFHKGALILSGDKEDLMKVREVIEEALR